MTDYEYDNLPDELEFIEALPDAMFADAQAAFNQAMTSGEVLAQRAKIAYAYDRKGYLTTDTFGGDRRPSYTSSDDDLIIQLTIRVRSPHSHWNKNTLPLLIDLEAGVAEAKREAKRAELEAEIAAAEAEAEKAEATARQKREQLEALRKK